MWAPLPIYDPTRAVRFHLIHAAMRGLKGSGQAVGAQVLTRLGEFAPTTSLPRPRGGRAPALFNLVVTNVPGPQIPLYLLGREMLAIYPVVPLASNQASASRS